MNLTRRHLFLTPALIQRLHAKEHKVKAIVFDTFGTLFDWRSSIIAEGKTWNRPNIDWPHFADRWRAGYTPIMKKVRTGELPWTKLDGLHRMLLDDLLKEFKIDGLSEAEKEHWNLIWHRLKPWPDTAAGLARLKKKYIIAPLSNGNVSLLTDLAKNAGVAWDLILSAELARHYKPDREVYLTAVELLSLQPGGVMMAAAHRVDLVAARECGLRTGFLARPHEFGPAGGADTAKDGEFDVVAKDMADFVAKLA